MRLSSLFTHLPHPPPTVSPSQVTRHQVFPVETPPHPPPYYSPLSPLLRLRTNQQCNECVPVPTYFAVKFSCTTPPPLFAPSPIFASIPPAACCCQLVAFPSVVLLLLSGLLFFCFLRFDTRVGLGPETLKLTYLVDCTVRDKSLKLIVHLLSSIASALGRGLGPWSFDLSTPSNSPMNLLQKPT